jgi:hypothetical protein
VNWSGHPSESKRSSTPNFCRGKKNGKYNLEPEYFDKDVNTASICYMLLLDSHLGAFQNAINGCNNLDTGLSYCGRTAFFFFF